ncbi:hypothetical protein BDV26DRAFT_260771 [Aspergillus bertholletiae]|uniref:Uncharacterized protein n=1 Tax=Aspergillus bertholletiae TaxID=1226010 RepID=A0A5N7BAU6_9EURO|nr:hypothetical protein BDV26DRAFT_260771 [Aspergillus bertholletiae]
MHILTTHTCIYAYYIYIRGQMYGVIPDLLSTGHISSFSFFEGEGGGKELFSLLECMYHYVYLLGAWTCIYIYVCMCVCVCR